MEDPAASPTTPSETEPLLPSPPVVFNETEITEYTEDNEEQEDSDAYIPYTEVIPIYEHESDEVGIVLEEISCFRSETVYLLAYNMFALIGSGLMYINNVGALGTSRLLNVVISLLPEDMDAHNPLVQQLQKRHVALISMLSFLARIVIGFSADICLNSFRIPKTLWALVGAGLVTAGFGSSLYVTHADQLTWVTCLISIGYGTIWTSMPILVGEYFGLKNFAKNWCEPSGLILGAGWRSCRR
jgi:hypothetical protein